MALQLSIAARDRMQQEYTRLLSGGRLSRSQSKDFLAYLEQLELRIAQQCLQLAGSYPERDSAQLPCRAEMTSGHLSTRLSSEQTPQEQLAVLDASLAGELAEFDEKLLREQQKLDTRQARASESVSGGSGSDGGGDGGENGAAGSEGAAEGGASESGETGSTGDGGAEGDRGTGGGIEGPRNGGRSPPPDNVPDGSDDDVVARQLREAAEKETDPDLKRRLWEEYRRYKASTK